VRQKRTAFRCVDATKDAPAIVFCLHLCIRFAEGAHRPQGQKSSRAGMLRRRCSAGFLSLEHTASLCSVQKDKLAVAAAAASKKRTAKAAAIRQSVATAGAPQPPAKVTRADILLVILRIVDRSRSAVGRDHLLRSRALVLVPSRASWLRRKKATRLQRPASVATVEPQDRGARSSLARLPS